LTEAGKSQTRAVAVALKKTKNPAVEAIWSSPLVRAWQTAELISEVLGLEVEECEELACGTSVDAFVGVLVQRSAPERLMLVGHEPDMGHFVSALSGAPPPFFQKAAVAKLNGDFRFRGMKQEWYLPPAELLGNA
jgi:phosphohistidine phosphatase SixA